jgi:hypothetical protein
VNNIETLTLYQLPAADGKKKRLQETGERSDFHGMNPQFPPGLFPTVHREDMNLVLTGGQATGEVVNVLLRPTPGGDEIFNAECNLQIIFSPISDLVSFFIISV